MGIFESGVFSSGIFGTRQAAAGGGGATPTIDLNGHPTNTSYVAAYEFNIPFTSPSYVAIIASGSLIYDFGGSSRSIDSISVNGEAATIHVDYNSGDHNGDLNVSILALAGIFVAEGTELDIIITWKDKLFCCGCACWSIYDLSDYTPVDIGFAESDADPGEDTLTTEADGVAIGGIGMRADGTPAQVTWTGVTEEYDEIFNKLCQSGGSNSTDGNDLTFSADYDEYDADGAGMVCATFR